MQDLYAQAQSDDLHKAANWFTPERLLKLFISLALLIYMDRGMFQPIIYWGLSLISLVSQHLRLTLVNHRLYIYTHTAVQEQ